MIVPHLLKLKMQIQNSGQRTAVVRSSFRRVKAVHDVIKETAASSAGLLPASRLSVGEPDRFLSAEEHGRVEAKLRDLLSSVCDYCNERLASLVSTQSEGQTVTAAQVVELSRTVEEFAGACEATCGRQSAALKAAFKIRAGGYVHRFHGQRKSKLTLLLDAERWKLELEIAEFMYEVSHATWGDAT
ncbi:hypothetical protein NQ318_007024 [Aromia moschata]|uniref:Uncharacterized protein n=1 Tax=Aromia moschata TaxID=1265417 RepID=A0AAV8Y3W9_9CUCU|nr:hypothetical protein NQ318_007024 [Aromia moschata]